MTYLFLLEKCLDEAVGIDSDLLSELIVSLLNLVLAFDTLLLHLGLDLFHLILLLLLKCLLLLGVLLLGGQSDRHLELLFDRQVGLVFGLSVFFLELLNLVVFLLLELF